MVARPRSARSGEARRGAKLLAQVPLSAGLVERLPEPSLGAGRAHPDVALAAQPMELRLEEAFPSGLHRRRHFAEPGRRLLVPIVSNAGAGQMDHHERLAHERARSPGGLETVDHQRCSVGRTGLGQGPAPQPAKG
jgi:hypothetical protein